MAILSAIYRLCMYRFCALFLCRSTIMREIVLSPLAYHSQFFFLLVGSFHPTLTILTAFIVPHNHHHLHLYIAHEMKCLHLICSICLYHNGYQHKDEICHVSIIQEHKMTLSFLPFSFTSLARSPHASVSLPLFVHSHLSVSYIKFRKTFIPNHKIVHHIRYLFGRWFCMETKYTRTYSERRARCVKRLRRKNEYFSASFLPFKKCITGEKKKRKEKRVLYSIYLSIFTYLIGIESLLVRPTHI